jgi:hypothetical protein
MRQIDLFAAADNFVAADVPETPAPETVRVRLHAMLDVVRAASEMPWEPPRARAQELVFANMASWLPEHERDALRQAFTAEMVRLRNRTKTSSRLGS